MSLYRVNTVVIEMTSPEWHPWEGKVSWTYRVTVEGREVAAGNDLYAGSQRDGSNTFHGDDYAHMTGVLAGFLAADERFADVVGELEELSGLSDDSLHMPEFLAWFAA